MTQTYTEPRPIFDTLEHMSDLHKKCQVKTPRSVITTWLKECLGDYFELLPRSAIHEYHQALMFLYSYRGSPDTFNSYRREIERFIQWSWFIHKKSIITLRRLDIEEFIEFAQHPPKTWISTKIVSRFFNQDGERIVNPEWKPFIVKVSKKASKDGVHAKKGNFKLSQQALKQIFAILGTFYNALIQEEATDVNPILQIRQKSKFIQKQSSPPMIRRLSTLQWKTVLECTEALALENPEVHRRTLFMMQCLYGMYLRISELSASKRWTPKMADFFRDGDGNWWFKTVGKGYKMRQIAVSSEMLQALKDYRAYLGVAPLPSPDDMSPLIPKSRGQGPISSTPIIRRLVQGCFNAAVEKLKDQNQPEEAEMLRSATVHWLRHTGISDDVKIRPREHVRDDAGHSSSAITDRYIDIELKERAESARNKEL